MKIRISIGLALLLTASIATSQNQQAVSALGRFEPENGLINVSASSMPQAVQGGIVAELLVEAGDDVSKGDLLAVTDTAAVLEAFALEAEASLVYAKREVEAARSKAVEACVRADVAVREAARRVRLHEQGVMGEEEADSAQGEADAQKASCASASTNVHLFEAGIDVARARLNRTRAEAQRSYVRAPADGRVIEIIARPGEIVGEQGILQLARIGRMFAIAEVYETDIRTVKKGQRAIISSAALDEDLSGRVDAIRQKVQKQDQIGTDPAARRDARIIEVEILLDDPGPAASLTNLQVYVVIQP